MIPVNLLNQTVDIKRRVSTGIDSLGNPTYGAPTGGTGWSTVYKGISVRFAFSSKPIQFSPEGERLTPNGVMYYSKDINLKAEDRVLTNDTGIEYTVISIVAGYLFGKTVDHFEAILQLP